MLNLKQANRELFNDGVCILCRTDKRKIVANVARLRFGIRTVGVTRFYQAKIADSGIDKLISVPFNSFISSKHIVLINDEQYNIKLVQEKYDTVPPSMYITLQKTIPAYEDERQ